MEQAVVDKYRIYLELVFALGKTAEALEVVKSDPELLKIASDRLGRQNLDGLESVIFEICAQNKQVRS